MALADLYRLEDGRGWRAYSTSREGAAAIAKVCWKKNRSLGPVDVIAPNGERWRWAGEWKRVPL